MKQESSTWQRPVKIGDRFALALEQPALDLVYQNIAAPAVFDRLMGIPKALFLRIEVVQQAYVMTPG